MQSAMEIAVFLVKVDQISSFRRSLIPFLLLFTRWRDRWTWLLLGAFLGALTVLGAGGPENVRDRFLSIQSAYQIASVPGRVLDQSPLNPASFSVISFDHLLTRVGIDRESARTLNVVANVVIGLGVLVVVVRYRTTAADLCCAIVSVYAVTFSYHRTYDLPLVILAMMCIASRLREEAGRLRWLYWWALFALVLALNVPVGVLADLQAVSASRPILAAFVLPLPMYLLLSVLATLVVAVALESPRRMQRSVAPATPALS